MNTGESQMRTGSTEDQTRRSAYFLCAEFVGAGDRLSHLEHGGAEAFLAPYLTSLRERLVSNGASLIDVREWTVHAAFTESAHDVVGAAEEMQQAIADLTNADRTFPLSLKIGLIVSEVWLHGSEILWAERPVALAAALCSNARAGQILMTGAFLELVSDRQLDLRVAGRFDSPLLPVPVQAVEVLWSTDGDEPHGWPAALPPQLSSPTERVQLADRDGDRLRRIWRRCESESAVSHRQLIGGTPEQRLDSVAALAVDAHRSGAVVAYVDLSAESSHPVAGLARSFRSWAAGQPVDTLSSILGDELPRVVDWIPEIGERLPIHPRLVAEVSDADVLAHLAIGAARSGPILWVIDGSLDGADGMSEVVAGVRASLEQAGSTALLLELRGDEHADGVSDIGAIRVWGSPPTGSVTVGPAIVDDDHWRGLAVYREEDSDVFFGQETMIAELLGLVERSRAVALVGEQWTGKSSLLSAGLVPALRSGALRGSERWRVLTLHPGDNPIASLAEAVAVHSPIEGSDVASTLVSAAKEHGNLLIIVDQFEEVFTEVDAIERAKFLNLLAELIAEPRGNIRLLVAVRTENYGACAEHRTLGPSFERNLLLLRSPSAQALGEIIHSPARVGGFSVDDDVAAQLIAASADRNDALPRLSHLLLTLERRRNGGPLTSEAYATLGGLDRSLGQCAEELYLVADDPGALRDALLGFLGFDAFGREQFVSRRAFDLTNEHRSALQPLIDASLARQNNGQICLAGGLIVAGWPRARAWFDTEIERVRLEKAIEKASRDWEAEHRHPSLLLTGPDLRQATRRWIDGEGDLSPLARLFLHESWQAETSQQERHLQRIVKLERRQLFLYTVFALGALCIALAVLLSG